MYDPRIARFSSTDPRFKEFPWLSPYAYAANNPIFFIDKNGEGPEPPPFGWQPVTRQMFIDIVKANGWDFQRRANESNKDFGRRYTTTLGRIFENNVLNVLGLKKNTKRIYPYRFNNSYTIPDAVEISRFQKISEEKLFGVFNQVDYVLDFDDGLFFEAKFSKNIQFEQEFNPLQFKKQIDGLANANEATRHEGLIFRETKKVTANAKDYGAAVLVLITPSDAVIDDELVEYATQKGVVVILHHLEFEEYGDDTVGDYQGKLRLSKGEYLNPEVIKNSKYGGENGDDGDPDGKARNQGDRQIGREKEVIIKD